MDDPRYANRTEEELWLEYKQSHSMELRNAFICQYMPLVKYVAGKLAVGLPPNLDFDDLVSYGNIGLMDAIEKYDPERQIQFKTYAVTRIRGAIYDALREQDWVPRSVRAKAKELEERIGELEAKLGRPASEAEIAAHMGISEEELQDTLRKVAATSVVSLNNDARYSSGEDSDHIAVIDTIVADPSGNPENIAEREDVKRVIVEAIAELPEKEKLVLVLYYHEDLTFKEIGKVLQVSESRISQLHTKANMHLRSKLTNVRKGII
jgi:RNA polymerase sigma factor for flagellar operon FliA